jgi:hypothetical protein
VPGVRTQSQYQRRHGSCLNPEKSQSDSAAFATKKPENKYG